MLRSYKVLLKKSGHKTPRIELTEIGKLNKKLKKNYLPSAKPHIFCTGPSIDFSIRRTKIASDDLYKQSRRQPKQLRVTKKKNITRDELGNTHGRVHVGKQNVKKVQTRKVRALRATPEEKKAKRQLKKAELRKVKAAAAV